MFTRICLFLVLTGLTSVVTHLSTICFLSVSSFMFPTITSGGWFNLIPEEGPFSSWDSESGEVDIFVASSTTLGVSRVLRDVGSCLTISWTSFSLRGRIYLGNSSLTFLEPEFEDSSITTFTISITFMVLYHGHFEFHQSSGSFHSAILCTRLQCA